MTHEDTLNGPLQFHCDHIQHFYFFVDNQAYPKFNSECTTAFLDEVTINKVTSDFQSTTQSLKSFMFPVN